MNLTAKEECPDPVLEGRGPAGVSILPGRRTGSGDSCCKRKKQTEKTLCVILIDSVAVVDLSFLCHWHEEKKSEFNV